MKFFCLSLKKRALYLAVLLLSFSSVALAQTQAYTIETIPNNRQQNSGYCVSNPDGLISKESESRLNQACRELERRTGVETAIVAINSVGPDDYSDFALNLFNYWHIGKKNKNNGLLIILVSNERAVKIQTGLGLEGLMPDAYCNEVLEETVFPYFKRGNFDRGFEEGMKRITEDLTTQAAMEELMLNSESTERSIVNIVTGYLIISFILTIIGLYWSYQMIKKLKGANDQQYNQMEPLMRTVTIVSYLFPIPLLLLTFWLNRKRRKVRQRPIKCEECGSSMRLLSEAEEDPYLQDYQITEENLKAIDYDVWLCNTCQHTRIFRYTGHTSYTNCPHCGAMAYKIESDRVTLPATSLCHGEGVRVYTCQHCHYQKKESYTIPKLAIAAGAVAASGRRGFSGSFGGGGFGGGMSGGGGAGGHF